MKFPEIKAKTQRDRKGNYFVELRVSWEFYGAKIIKKFPMNDVSQISKLILELGDAIKKLEFKQELEKESHFSTR